MTAIDTTDLGNFAGTSFINFKNSYTTNFIGTQYYNELKAEATAKGLTSLTNYADRQKAFSSNFDTKAKIENEFMRVDGARQGVDLTRGSDAWFQVQYQKMIVDYSTRVSAISNGGSGDLSYDTINQINENAASALDLKPSLFFTYTPLQQSGEASPAVAQTIFDGYNGSGSSAASVLDLSALTMAPVPLTNATQMNTNLADKMQWINETTIAVQDILDTYHPSDENVWEETLGSIRNEAGITEYVLRNLGDWLKAIGIGLEDGYLTLKDFIQKILDDLHNADGRSSPLVLDLNHSGTIELVSLANTNAYFDILGSDFANKTGWVSPNDGLLAFDKNFNGTIDSGKELFGTASGAVGGFEDLAAYDSNTDGAITAGDSIWTKLTVWQDSDGDGYTDAGELHTLGDLGITSISLSFTQVNQTNQGHTVTETGTFSQGGNNYAVHDVWFQYDAANSIYYQPYQPDFRAGYLPSQRGYGILPDLHIAESLDNTSTGNLLSLVDSLAIKTFAQLFDSTSAVPDLVRSIMFRWAGVEGVASDARGAFVDGRELGFLEHLTGEAFVQRGGYTNPYGYEAGYDLQEAFRIAFDNMYSRLLAQSAGAQLFTGTPVYDLASDSFTGITGLNSTSLASLQSEATGLASTALRQTFWDNVVRVIEFATDIDATGFASSKTALANAIHNSDAALILGVDTAGSETGIRADLVFHRPVGVDETGTSGDDTMNGSTSDDVLDGYYGNDTVNGLAGNDRLYGGSGNDTLTGGLGGDFLRGDLGNDTFVYARGDGEDTVFENGSGWENTILFQTGITLSQLTLTRMANEDLVIDVAGGGRIVVVDQFNGYGQVATLTFADGSSAWNILAHSYEVRGTDAADTIYAVYSGNGGDINDVIHGGGGNDTLNGNSGNNVMYGDAGNDVLVDTYGDDMLYGGDGNDTITGGGGNDTFLGGAGDDTVVASNGNDTFVYESGKDVYSAYSGTDTLLLDARWNGVTAHYQQMGNDLLIWFDDQDTIMIKEWNLSGYPQMETMVYADSPGSPVSLAVTPIGSATAAANTIAGTTGDDVIFGLDGNDVLNGTGTDGADRLYGGNGNDTLKGGNGADWLQGDAGNDILQGGANNDTYYFTGGLDEITEGGGTDTLKLLEGPKLDTISFSDSGNDRTVVLAAGINEIKLVGQLGTDATKVVEWLEFGDGFRINLAGTTPWTTVTGNFTGSGSIADTVVGNGTGNNINGGAGDDTLYGGAGADYITGGDGIDYGYGGDGDDPSVRGGKGDDKLWGGAGNDTVDGEQDNDELWGGTGVNRLEGGDGNDILWGGNEGTAATPEQLRGESGKDTIHGGEGVDEALGGGGDDVIYGNGGDDTLYGDAGDDEIHGGAGADIIRGDEGRDALYGDEGNDDVRGGLDDNILHGGAGDDLLWGGYLGSDTFYGNDTLYGDAGNDTLNGSLGNDTLDGGTGNDSSYGGGGDDSYVVSAGADYIQDTGGTTDRLLLGPGIDLNDVSFLTSTGTDANDLIVAIFGRSATIEDQAVSNNGPIEQIVLDDGFYVNSSIYTQWFQGTSAGAANNGGSGINIMLGYGGNDTLQGRGNNDFLHGGDGNDTLWGADSVTDTTDDDFLHGGRGDDTLHGGSGNDTLWGGEGDDALYGDAGNDIYVLTAGTDTITESGGTDSIRLRGGLLPENLTFTNTGTWNLTLAASLGTFVITNQRDGTAANHVDTLLFEDGFQLNLGLYGTSSWYAATSSGQQILGDNNNASGVNTADVIIGHEGDNTLKGYDADDQIAGGSGNDTLWGGTGNDLLHGESGNDTAYGEAGTDTLWGGSGTDTLRGGDDADTLHGGDGDDSALWGENGDDIVYGDAGNDTIRGDAGADALHGGDGDDTIYGASNTTDSTDNDVLYGDAGDDHLFGQSGDDTLYGGFNADELRGGAGIDTLWGESGEDKLYGDAGADTLHGGDGNDTLYGAGSADSTDNDVLYGEDGDDFLYGQSGTDTLIGGLGADTLQGDAGADTYIWAAGTGDDGDGVDTIVGFSTAQGDVIDISDLLVGYNPVTSAITNFVRITDSGTASVLDVDVDGTGSGSTWVHVGTLSGVTGLTDEQALLTNGNLLAA